jgi:hypothetical protein
MCKKPYGPVRCAVVVGGVGSDLALVLVLQGCSSSHLLLLRISSEWCVVLGNVAAAVQPAQPEESAPKERTKRAPSVDNQQTKFSTDPLAVP